MNKSNHFVKENEVFFRSINSQSDALKAQNHVNLGKISMNFRPKAMVAPNKNKKV